MAKFKDATGRDWTVQLDAPTISEVRRNCDVDLLDMEAQACDRLADDPVELVNVLYVICREQADKQNVTDLDFGRALVGDPIDEAAAALLEALADFFPARKRLLLRSLAAKTAAIREKGLALAETRINDPKLLKAAEAAMEEQMTKALETAMAKLKSGDSTKLQGNGSAPSSAGETESSTPTPAQDSSGSAPTG